MHPVRGVNPEELPSLPDLVIRAKCHFVLRGAAAPSPTRGGSVDVVARQMAFAAGIVADGTILGAALMFNTCSKISC